MAASAPIYTIGHSTHEVGEFLGLLTTNGITAVADVRSVPASRFNPQFNRASLKQALGRSGIDYAFLGRELGARSDDPTCYVDGKVQYDRLAQQPEFHEGIARLLRGRLTHRIAVMCAEAEPLDCHRTLLVARHLVQHSVEIIHIHRSGALEADTDAMLRLRARFELDNDALFENDDVLADAIRRRVDQIAYIEGDSAESGM